MNPERPIIKPETTEKQLDAGTWGVFFLWLVISFLAHMPWGVWLLGVGVIVVGAQLGRRMIGAPLDGFWLVAGSLFVLGGISNIVPFGLHVAVIPVLCIAVGVVLLAKALLRGAGPRHA